MWYTLYEAVPLWIRLMDTVIEQHSRVQINTFETLIRIVVWVYESSTHPCYHITSSACLRWRVKYTTVSAVTENSGGHCCGKVPCRMFLFLIVIWDEYPLPIRPPPPLPPPPHKINYSILCTAYDLLNPRMRAVINLIACYIAQRMSYRLCAWLENCNNSLTSMFHFTCCATE